MHIRTRPGNEEVSVRQGWFAEAQIDPFARCAVEPAAHLCHVFFGHTVGEVATVTLVPALQPAIVAKMDESLDEGCARNKRFVGRAGGGIEPFASRIHRSIEALA
ncbi:unknown [Eggerthella sp. CAG:298]|nr:unknown [Eggerthella sp. CAG:298]